ncbi:hypothetical protein AC1031_006271 [Aphanomyces cochlioides]|nr:hypothetical protein AC1031_006271 [Aphanomyces cochlioides]
MAVHKAQKSSFFPDTEEDESLPKAMYVQAQALPPMERVRELEAGSGGYVGDIEFPATRSILWLVVNKCVQFDVIMKGQTTVVSNTSHSRRRRGCTEICYLHESHKDYASAHPWKDSKLATIGGSRQLP